MEQGEELSAEKGESAPKAKKEEIHQRPVAGEAMAVGSNSDSQIGK